MSNDFSLNMDNSSIQIEGFDELKNSFEELIRKYPDRAGELLQKEGKSLRKDVVLKINKYLDVDTESKRSLGKVSSYTVTEAKGIGETQYVEVIAKSPHFHLIENGHDIVLPKTRTIKLKNGSKKKISMKNGGKRRGFVVGYKFMDEAARDRQEKIPETVEKMVDELLKEGGLL